MDFITTKEAAAKWNISTIRITILANEGRIPGAKKFGKSWMIPANASKPTEFKPFGLVSVRKEKDDFSFPLYHYRPDWSYIQVTQLSKQQQSLLQAETAVLECRFTDAYPLLEAILQTPENISVEFGCLYYVGICCIALNKPDDFSRFYLRLQMLLSDDFPHRDDLIVIRDVLKTYVDTIGSSAKRDSFKTDVHDQCLPLTYMMMGFTHLTREIMKPGKADVPFMELGLRYLQTTSAVIVMEMMHCYLLGIYLSRQNIIESEKHAKALVQLTYESKIYFPLVTYYRYLSPALSPVLSKYPEEFQNQCHELITQYNENYAAFLSSINEHTVLAKLSDEDYPYVCGVLMNLPNTNIAEKLGVHPQTVKNKLDKVCKMFNIKNKKELKNYLHNYT